MERKRPGSLLRPNAMFPTPIAVTIAKRGNLYSLPTQFSNDGEITDAIIDVQKIALVDGGVENARIVFRHWIEEDPDEEQLKAIDSIYEVTKLEASGEIVGLVAEILKGNGSDRDKLEASRILNEIIKGNETATSGEIRGLIVNLYKTKTNN